MYAAISDTLIVELITTNVSCYNGSDGIITAIASGGTAPYSYTWSNDANTQTNANLQAGNYILTVSDLMGCSSVLATSIYQPTALQLFLQTDGGLCGEAVNIETNPYGGIAPYHYLWSNGASEKLLTDVDDAIYTVTVTDQNGCTNIDSIQVISDNNQLLFDVFVQTPTCNSSTDGVIQLELIDGQAPFTYFLNGEFYTGSFQNLSPDTYVIYVMDANDCSFGTTVALLEPEPITIDILNFGNGLEAIASNGVAPYSFEWSNGASQSWLTNLAPDTYQVTVTDQNGCTAIQFADVLEPLSNDNLQNDVQFSIFPNPCKDFCSIQIATIPTTPIEVSIYDSKGQQVAEEQLMSNQLELPVQNLNPGIYFVSLKAKNQLFTQKIVVLD